MPENIKTEKTSLYELGEEYEKIAKIQDSFINQCKAEIKKAEASGESDAVLNLKRNLSQFRAIKRELTETASKLKNYYQGEKR